MVFEGAQELLNIIRLNKAIHAQPNH
jgi:hypothetical protein